MSSGFITESEAAEARNKRQEQWDKVRKPDDPVERPEEPYDPRSLYDRLQEQKQKKDFEYEEAHKLKNMIKGLDDDEIEFLDLVDRTKIAADRKKELEEERELNDYRNRVAILQEKTLEERLHAEIAANRPKAVISNRPSQQKLLKGIVVKRCEAQKRKISDSSSGNSSGDGNSDREQKQVRVEQENMTTAATNNNAENSVNIVPKNSGLHCVGILPGLGCYTESSSDEDSSYSESEVEHPRHVRIDLLGRKIVPK